MCSNKGLKREAHNSVNYLPTRLPLLDSIASMAHFFTFQTFQEDEEDYQDSLRRNQKLPTLRAPSVLSVDNTAHSLPFEASAAMHSN